MRGPEIYHGDEPPSSLQPFISLQFNIYVNIYWPVKADAHLILRGEGETHITPITFCREMCFIKGICYKDWGRNQQDLKGPLLESKEEI